MACMASITVAAAKNQFSDLLRRAEYGGERVIVERHGKPVAVIVSTYDLKRLEALEEADDVREAAQALQEAAEHGTIPLEVVLHKHGLDHLMVQGRTRSRNGKRKPPTRPLGRTARAPLSAVSQKRRRRQSH